jgi:hypothetical protein
MDPAVAALIGAGVGAGSSLTAQLLTHRLSLRRDRRNLLREQRFAAVETAALSLAKSKPDSTDRAAPEGSILGDHPEIAGIAEDMSLAIALLQVHFGTNHRVVRSYADTWAICANAKVKIAANARIVKRRIDATIGPDATQKDVENIASAELEADAKALLEVLDARDAWTSEARCEAMKT